MAALGRKRRANRYATRAGRFATRFGEWLLEAPQAHGRTPRWQKRAKVARAKQAAQQEARYGSLMARTRYPMRPRVNGRYKRWKASRKPVRPSAKMESTMTTTGTTQTA